MGVLGLWRLLDATGKPVPLETLEGKVLAIDVSIWIHQVVQGYQDRRGNSVPNAHLIGLFNRICKLMYYKIKPVFIFDGGVPLLKKNTIAMRRKLKSMTITKAQKLRNDLINNLIKRTVVSGALDKVNDAKENNVMQQFKDSTSTRDSLEINDMYKLADVPSTSKLLDSDDYTDSDENEAELSPRKQTKWIGNIHSVDVNNEEFKSLPADIRYDILTDLKETRKQNSWGRLHELPSGSNNYSGFQVKRLLKRRFVQESLEVAEKEMGGKTLTLEELDRLLTDQGVDTTQHHDTTYRIASDSVTRVVYIKDKPTTQNNSNENSNDSDNSKLNLQKNAKVESNNIEVDTQSINSDTSEAVINDIHAYDLDESWLSDESFADTTINSSHLSSINDIPKSIINPALAYMLEHSGLTRDQILQVVEQTKKNKKMSSSNSSCSSSKKGKRTSNKLATKNKKKKSFNSIIPDTSTVKKETLKSSETNSTIVSSSKANDSTEILENINNKEEQNITQNSNETKCTESSDSGSDDFIEIQDVHIPEAIENNKINKDIFQIQFQASEELEDDMFADVFSNTNSQKKDISLQKQPLLQKKVILNNEHTLKLVKEEESVKCKAETEKSVCSNLSNDYLFFSNSENSMLECNNVNSKTVTSDTNERIVSDCLTVSQEKKDNIIVNDGSPQDVSEQDQKIVMKDNLSLNSDVTYKSNVSENVSNDNAQKQPSEKTIKEPSLTLPSNEKELELMKKQLETEQQQITGNLGKLERQATDITDQMRFEAQELLRLFGVPYIVAPMEAEAQCAYLEQIKLIDGTITDDSDVWLFGGQCIYKNFFDNNKKVLQFLSKDIEYHLKLSRKEMIQLALLVGSDYTNGLSGVGPVTALEILAAFPSDGEDILRGLRNFCAWFRAGRLTAPEKSSLRNKLKNVNMERGFPSQAVAQAYLTPTVDESNESFSWGRPNLVLLADYVRLKFGWTKLKFEEIITPVMKKLTSSKSQKGIEWYFKVHSIPKSIETCLSKRVQTAVEKLGKKNEDNKFSNSEAFKSTEPNSTKIRKTTIRKNKKLQDKSFKLSPILETEDDNLVIESDERLTEIVKKERQKILNMDVEIIPQKEKDKCNALKSKLKAIEVFRKSKKGLGRIKKTKKTVNKIKDEAELSESSSSS